MTLRFEKCEKCGKNSRLVMGEDTSGHRILGPCQPCMDKWKEETRKNA